MEDLFIQQPFDEFLGFIWRVSETSEEVKLPIQPLFLNTVEVVHGGIISSLADVARCNIFEVDENNRLAAITVDLKTTFIKGAIGEVLIAHAERIKKKNSRSCRMFNIWWK